ncbi:MAG: GtrA family protein [bacterium]|nr:GtrA family protein [bacterium]
MSERKIGQVGKFLITGCSNTAVDFSIISILLFIAPAPSSLVYMAYKIIAFSAASTNSYFLNKYYVFKSLSSGKKVISEKVNFIFSCLVSLGVNVLVSTVVFAWLVSTYPDISLLVAGNLGALLGTAVCLWWNYVAYKYLVFKIEENPTASTA